MGEHLSSRSMEIDELDPKELQITTSNFMNDKNSLIILIELAYGIIFTFFWNWAFWILIPNTPVIYMIMLPLSIFGNMLLFVFSINVFSMILFKIIRKKHPPKEGIFSLDTLEGKEEFRYYRLRYWTAYFPLWLTRALPLPWMDFVVMRMFGAKIGGNVCLYDSWIDIELVEIGDNVMTSLNTVIMSHGIYKDKFLQMKTVLMKNAITGSQSVVAPGSILEEGAVLGANCGTHIGQVLKADMIHVGNPVFKSFPSIKPIDKIKEEMRKKKEGSK